MVSLCAPTVITTKASTFAISHQIEMLQTADRWDAFFNNNAQWRQQKAVSGSFGNVSSVQRMTETPWALRLQAWIAEWLEVSCDEECLASSTPFCAPVLTHLFQDHSQVSDTEVYYLLSEPLQPDSDEVAERRASLHKHIRQSCMSLRNAM